MADESSRLRQRLRALHDRIGLRLQELLAERPGLILGTFGTRERVCGNPGCHCARGELHASKYLAASVQGRTRQVHVPAGDEIRVAQGVERSREWRRLREEIRELEVERDQVLGALFASLVEPYPPDDPLPLPGPRGRRPREG